LLELENYGTPVDLHIWKRMFVQAALEKPWFRDLLLSAVERN